MNEEIAKMIEEEKTRELEEQNVEIIEEKNPVVEDKEQEVIIENKIQIIKENDNMPTAPIDTQLQNTIIGQAMQDTKKTIVEKAMPKINDDKIVEKHAKKLAENADESIRVELETQELEIQKADTSNKVTKKEIQNQLLALKEESKRIKREQKHLSKLQKLRHKQESDKNYWEAHKETLALYKMKEGSNRTFCDILLWLDGVKGFLNGVGIVNNAIVKALRWILIVCVILAVLFIIPVTRNWMLLILGFLN